MSDIGHCNKNSFVHSGLFDVSSGHQADLCVLCAICAILSLIVNIVSESQE